MAFDEFIDAAWDDHGDRPEDVAGRLESSLSMVESAAHVPPYARLVTHVFGEHLGEFRRGVALLESLRALPCVAGSADAAAAIARGAATLRCVAGDDGALATLPGDERIAALAIASSALAARGETGRALAAYDAALAAAAPGLPAGAPALRALAIGGNNLAATFEEKPDRSAAETAGMVRAAQAGLTYWKLAGGWLEEERAEYRLARSLLQAGDALAAVDAARRCIQVCEANDAPAFERFFGYAALAIALGAAGDAAAESARATALELHALVPADEQTWCAADLALLS